MRILQLRFRNLNSLAGEWAIDLTHPAYAADGIFAITGPTGAGKTTILDAICLALYGRTPRLNKVTRSGNEIMSRQTGDCFAEVTFETRVGRYRCHWSQHRARKKADGELQAPKHEIANADTGEIFETRLRGVAEQIEAATGMDFDRFTRSILLAQGGFAAFLQAAPDERAPILEQITGSEIYSRISIRVHERQRQEQEQLNLLQAETAGIEILEPEQERQMQQQLEAKQQEEADLATRFADTDKAIRWLIVVDGLKQELISLADEACRLQSDIDAFAPQRDKLNRALQAASLDGCCATLAAIRKQQADDHRALSTEQQALPDLEAATRDQAKALLAAQEQAIEAKRERTAATPLMQRVRALDQTLGEQQMAAAEAAASCKKTATNMAADKQARLRQQAERSDAEAKLKLVEAYLNAHAQDQWLIGGLAAVEAQLANMDSLREELRQKKIDQQQAAATLARATKTLDECQRQCGSRQRELDQAANDLQQGKAALSRLLGGRLLREYRTEKDVLHRELAFQARIAELEEHRAKLEDGQPCPLCGATEHPFAQGNVAVADSSEQAIEVLIQLIDRAEKQEAAIKKLEQLEATARMRFTEAEKQEAAAAHDRRAAEQALIGFKQDLEKRQTGFAELKQAVAAKLLPLGIAQIADSDMSSLLDQLAARLDAWQNQVAAKAAIEQHRADLDSELKRLDAVIATQGNVLAEKNQRLETLNKAHALASAERTALYGDLSPDAEELRLQEAVAAAEAFEKQARDLHHERQQTWHTTRTRVESLQKRIDHRAPELRQSEAAFSAALASAGFADEQAFLEARLGAGQRDELAATAKQLDDRQTDLRARQKDRESRLAAEMASQLTDQSLEQLEPQCKEYEASLQQLRDSIAALTHKLSENAAAKERIKARQRAIEAQKKECRRWQNLHQLIGSADGKKYRNFAQGLTFEMMIAQANRQLQKMSDRYLLVRDAAQALELNVIDNYQAGDVRSTKNLSGGESFIVSLALALGLSNMASQNVRVDSLFLDEGFGTLDEDALDTALETLAGLQQDGKLIGVISHVSALKERISSQIQVRPQAGGRSTLRGPGCRKIIVAS